MTKELAKIETTTLETVPPATLQLAIEKGMPPETIAKLMDLQERWEANTARKQFVDAMSRFKAECPAVIGKDRKADFGAGKAKYSYATTGAIVTAITPALSKNGLSLSWETAQDARSVTVTCHVTHAGGHRESAILTGPHDESGGKNPIQMLGSSVHYLQRYTMVSVLGLATADMDDPDNHAQHREPVREPQARTPDAPPDMQPQTPAGAKVITGTIEAVTTKPTSNGGTRYGVKVQAQWFNTFSETIGILAGTLKEAGTSATLTYSTNERGFNDLHELTAAQ